MGCLKLNTNFCNVLQILPAEKRDYGEKKCVNYYPFGLKHKGYNNVINGTEHPYKYNGKELSKDLDLNLYEMDWRQYDATLGRFNVIDAYAEFMYDQTPYHFSYNSPLYFSDPSGLCPNGDCDDIGDNMEGDAILSDGVTWVVHQGVWTRNDGVLEEITLVGSSNKPAGPPTEEEAEEASQESDEPFMSHWGPSIWGFSTSDRLGTLGRAKNAKSFSVDARDIPPMGNNSKLWGQWFWNLVNYLAWWNDKVSKESDGNNSKKNQTQIVDSVQAKVRIIDIRINSDPMVAGRMSSLKDTTIVNTSQAKSSLEKYNEDVRSKARIEWRIQMDSIMQLYKKN